VQARYPEHAALMNRHYTQLFGPDTEIGRWLTTKNVAERVGNILFVHGGFSPHLNDMQLSLKELNNMIRPFYRDTTFEFPDRRLEILYSNVGPFWYRGYYGGTERASMQQIDNTLIIYGVRHIATGHTIISDHISTLFDGKLFNTDVHHAMDHSEGLLVENGKFFRVDASGAKSEVNELQVER